MGGKTISPKTLKIDVSETKAHGSKDYQEGRVWSKRQGKLRIRPIACWLQQQAVMASCTGGISGGVEQRQTGMAQGLGGLLGRESGATPVLLGRESGPTPVLRK